MYARGMSGLGRTQADCAADPACSAIQKAWCYSGGYFQSDCQAVRDGMFAPPTRKPPVVDAGGLIVGDPQDVLDKQSSDAQAAMIAAAQGQITGSWIGNVGAAVDEALPVAPDFLPVALAISAVAAFMLVKN